MTTPTQVTDINDDIEHMVATWTSMKSAKYDF